MGYLFILIFAFLGLSEGITIKEYGKRHGAGGMLVNALISLFAAIFFLITDKGGFSFYTEMIPLGILNAFLYASGFYLAYIAFKLGSFGLTHLIASFSLLFPVFYGLLFLDEESTLFTFIGLAGIIGAMALINFKKGAERAKESFSLKWLVCIVACAIANGFISIVTRYQQIRFNDETSNEFMMLSLGGAFIILIVLSLFIDGKNFKYILRHGTVYGFFAGLFNGAKNFVALIIYTYLPISVASPVQSGTSTILAFSASILLYKEKFSKVQIMGVILGAISVILLNI